MELDIFDMMIMDEIEEEENKQKKKANETAAVRSQLPKTSPKKEELHFTKRIAPSRPTKSAYYDEIIKGE